MWRCWIQARSVSALVWRGGCSAAFLSSEVALKDRDDFVDCKGGCEARNLVKSFSLPFRMKVRRSRKVAPRAKMSIASGRGAGVSWVLWMKDGEEGVLDIGLNGVERPGVCGETTEGVDVLEVLGRSRAGKGRDGVVEKLKPVEMPGVEGGLVPGLAGLENWPLICRLKLRKVGVCGDWGLLAGFVEACTVAILKYDGVFELELEEDCRRPLRKGIPSRV